MSCADAHTGVRSLPQHSMTEAKLWAASHQGMSEELAHWQGLHKSARVSAQGLPAVHHTRAAVLMVWHLSALQPTCQHRSCSRPCSHA